MSSVMTRRKGKSKSKSKSNKDDKDKEREMAPLLLPVETHGYKRYKNDRRKEEPFLVTNLKVGGVLAISLMVIYAIYSVVEIIRSGGIIGGGTMPTTESEGVWAKYVNDDGMGDGNGDGIHNDNLMGDEKSKIFPTFHLDEDEQYKASKYDAWGIAELFLQEKEHEHDDPKGIKKVWNGMFKDHQEGIQSFIDASVEIREQFADLYGGENAARAMLSLGLSTFEPTGGGTGAGSSSSSSNNVMHNIQIPEGLRCTAKRILNAKKDRTPLKFSFAGGGAVSGRGNYYDESFPSVMADILTEPLEMIGITLEVRNAAMADIGTFPYGFCLDNFLGTGADVVSFDPEMISRGDNTAAFESYLRHAMTMDHSPMFVMRETSYTETRRGLIQAYVDLGFMSDPIIFNVEAARSPFRDLDESIVPRGFQDWSEFSGPDGAPGKTRANIPKMQHELIGRMLSMHFLAAAELAIAYSLAESDGGANDGGIGLPKDFLDVGPASKPSYKHYYMPPPQTEENEQSKNVTLMFGSKFPGDQRWYMNEVHCRTSFDPIIYGGLDDIIVSGSDAEDIDLLRPRGAMLYNKNWVLDMGPVGKQLENNLEQYNLGYQDRRKGYFGVRPSGNLTMFLPFELNDSITKYEQLDEKEPSDMFKSVVVCQVNERAGCRIEKDVLFVLGGKPSQSQLLEANGVSYSGRKYCVSLSIPEGVTWSKRQLEGKEETKGWLRSSSSSSSVQEASGLSLAISVSNELVFWKDGPCSISHVIWEQYRDLDI